jgi:hypothetical protein
MHGVIRDRLEDLLAAGLPATASRRVAATYDSQETREHLSSCRECSSELDSMKAQCGYLRSLRVPEGQIEPSAGFYARVIQRVEESAKDSIWSVFIYSPFGTRLGFASLALAALLGTYVIGLEAKDGHLGGENVVSQASLFGDQDQRRDAVLDNLVSPQGSLQ